MPDNVGYTPGTGTKVATREVTYSGEAANAQAVGLVTFAGADDAKTATTSGRVERVLEIDAKIAETQTTIDEIEGT